MKNVTKTISKIQLLNIVDAQQMAIDHPDTFDAPSLFDLLKIEVGDNVKICCNSERFWCLVEDKYINGLLVSTDNILVMSGNEKLKLGTRIVIQYNQIYSVYKR